MSLWSRIKSLFTTAADARMFPALAGTGRLIHEIRREQKPRVDTSLETLRLALLEAENIYRPRRVLLQDIYREVVRDNHLRAGIRKRYTAILTERFKITANGQPQKEKTKLLETPWFVKILRYFVETEFYGHSLLEFGQMDGGQFTDVLLVPRRNIIPDTGEILVDTQSERTIAYRDSTGTLQDPYLIELGDPYDFGLLEGIAPMVMLKKYSLTDWARHSERYGMPTLHVRTGSNNNAQLAKYREMAEKIGANGYIITDQDTEVLNIEERRTDPHQIYENLISVCNAEISKGVSGETGTTEEKSFVGSAQVHERVLDRLGRADLLHFFYFANFQLLPFLSRHGYPFSPADTFEWSAVLEAESAPPPTPATPPVSTAKSRQSAKKKAQPRHTHKIAGADAAGLDLGDIIARVMREMHQSAIRAGDIDAELYEYTAAQLRAATQEGYGTRLEWLPDTSQYYENLGALLRFVDAFAAHKNAKFIDALAEALLDERGALKPFARFKREALAIHDTWNVEWLRAEYNLCVAAAQSARAWQDFTADPDITMLKYLTVGDANVRDAHRALDGITRPKSDAFWRAHYPPNGWGCRCTVLAAPSNAAPSPDLAIANLPAPPSGFDNNAGITGRILNPDTHPYFQGISPSTAERISALTARETPTTT